MAEDAPDSDNVRANPRRLLLCFDTVLVGWLHWNSPVFTECPSDWTCSILGTTCNVLRRIAVHHFGWKVYNIESLWGYVRHCQKEHQPVRDPLTNTDYSLPTLVAIRKYYEEYRLNRDSCIGILCERMPSYEQVYATAQDTLGDITESEAVHIVTAFVENDNIEGLRSCVRVLRHSTENTSSVAQVCFTLKKSIGLYSRAKSVGMLNALYEIIWPMVQDDYREDYFECFTDRCRRTSNKTLKRWFIDTSSTHFEGYTIHDYDILLSFCHSVTDTVTMTRYRARLGSDSLDEAYKVYKVVSRLIDTHYTDPFVVLYIEECIRVFGNDVIMSSTARIYGNIVGELSKHSHSNYKPMTAVALITTLRHRKPFYDCLAVWQDIGTEVCCRASKAYWLQSKEAFLSVLDTIPFLSTDERAQAEFLVQTAACAQVMD